MNFDKKTAGELDMDSVAPDLILQFQPRMPINSSALGEVSSETTAI